MASGALDIQQQKLAVEAKIKSMLNQDLKDICRGENLAVSGVKAQLQTRILAHLDDIIKRADVRGFERMRYRANHHGQVDGFSSPVSNINDSTSSISPAPTRHMPAQFGRPPLPGFQNTRPSNYPSRSISFRPSPFYTKVEPISMPQELAEMQSNRHTVNMTLHLNDSICSRLKGDPNQRIMIYCYAASGIAPYTPLDIAFPNQIEVKVNGDDVKSNFKGLKNKPGTTKPADITTLVRKAAGYPNNVQITYALTTKKYTVVINMVQKTSADALAERVKQGRYISKAQVLNEMAAKASDPDIIATSTVMSLKDPISTMRMSLPCRSTVCTHNQCFDGSYFLQLQEQAPTWTCPVCNKAIVYESLNVDQYVQDILQKTNSSTEQVTIEPDGSWHPVVQGDDTANRGKSQVRASYDNDSDDDIIEIQDSRMDKIKHEAVSTTPGIAQQTPPMSSREPSMAASTSARPNNKRSSAVIDLTLSDDDEPPRPAKRMHTSQNTSSSYNTPTSLPEGRFTDLGFRQSSSLGSGYTNGRPDTLPPIQAGPLDVGLPNGQRLPWPAGPSQTGAWPSFRESNGSYGNESR